MCAKIVPHVRAHPPTHPPAMCLIQSGLGPMGAWSNGGLVVAVPCAWSQWEGRLSPWLEQRCTVLTASSVEPALWGPCATADSMLLVRAGAVRGMCCVHSTLHFPGNAFPGHWPTTIQCTPGGCCLVFVFTAKTGYWRGDIVGGDIPFFECLPDHNMCCPFGNCPAFPGNLSDEQRCGTHRGYVDD